MISDSKDEFQFPVLEKSKYGEDIFESNRDKILLQRLRMYQDNYNRENEWQQEYYIIYNSYILDDKEPDFIS